MIARLTIRHLLAVLALLGLILAPLGQSATAMAAMPTSSAETADMPDGMSCCPGAQKKPDCAKDCPFLAVCAGMLFAPGAGVTGPAAPLALLAVIAPPDGAKRSGLSQPPPARPPKT